MNRRTGSAIVLCGLMAATARGEIELRRFYPPVVAAGTETEIAAEGKFSDWPAQFICDREDLAIVAAEKSGRIRVTAPSDSPPGVVWVRAHDESSATQLTPLLIAASKVTSEQEPNDQIDQATEVTTPQLAAGRLAKSGDVDTYRVSATAGETLVVSALAHRVLGSPMDMVMQLVDPDGNVLAQSDDVRGLDPAIVYPADRDSKLLVRVFAFPETPNSTIGFSGSDSFVYTLRITTGPFLDHVLPLVGFRSQPELFRAFGARGLLDQPVRIHEANEVSPPQLSVADTLGWQLQADGPANPTIVFDDPSTAEIAISELPIVFSGHIDRPDETDRLRFAVEKGESYGATVHSRRLGFAVDSVLRVVDVKSGETLERNDDASRDRFDASLDFKAKADGEVELQVSDLLGGHGPQHAYSVTVERRRPRVHLTLSADHFVCTAGQSMEIPVEIDRSGGFDRELRITAEQLPDRVSAEPATSKAKGDSAKQVKLKLTANVGVAFQGSIRVVGQAIDQSGEPASPILSAKFPLTDTISSPALWLTVK